MTDRELLEMAAKAVGYLETATVQDGCGFIALAVMDADGDWTGKDWNPLADDGDALRLAVKLDINWKTISGIVFTNVQRETEGRDDGALSPISEYIRGGCDEYTATRRAIVRAAAAIGVALDK